MVFQTTLVLMLFVACTSSTQISEPTVAETTESEQLLSEVPEDKLTFTSLDEPPVPSPNMQVSLAGLLAYADANAPSLAVARAKIELGAAEIAAAKPLFPKNPELSAEFGRRVTGSVSQTDWAVGLSQEIEIAGQRGARIDAAHLQVVRYRSELHAERWHVHRRVHNLYYQAVVVRERLVAIERLLEFQHKVLSIAKRSKNAGDISELQVELVNGQTTAAKVAHIAAQQAYADIRRQLAVLCGWPSRFELFVKGNLDAPRAPRSTKVLYAIALKQHPALQVLRAESAIRKANEQVARLDAWPNITVGVAVARESQAMGPNQIIYTGGISIPIPLWQRNNGARARAAARSRVANSRVANYQASLLQRIDRYRSAVIASSAQVNVYGEELLPSFERNLRMTLKSFELGEIDAVQLSVAQERFLKTQRDALDAYAAYYKAVANLESTVGSDAWSATDHEDTHEGESQ